MAEINLTQYGITGTTEIVHNPSYELLYEEETKADLTGYEKGQESELGAVNVKTGVYTGRSPKDKYIVMDENSKDTVWWTSDEYANDNHPLSEENWAVLKDLAKKGAKLFLRTCSNKCLTSLITLVLGEVLHESACKILSLSFPISNICICVTRI